jgi:hypothetical protein
MEFFPESVCVEEGIRVQYAPYTADRWLAQRDAIPDHCGNQLHYGYSNQWPCIDKQTSYCGEQQSREMLEKILACLWNFEVRDRL